MAIGPTPRAPTCPDAIAAASAFGVLERMDAFRDRVAVITGGAGGIGMGLARAFAARGAKLVLADLDDAALARAATTLREAGATVHTVPTDVGDRAQVEALADETFRHYGAAHVVCNNAGIALFGEIAHATHKDWEYTMRVNFWGVVHGVEAFVPRLVAQRQGGHVVNTASMAGLVGMQWLGVYCASKFAVVGLTEALDRELRPHGIGVSVLCPMIVETNINANSLRNRPAALRNPDHTDAPPDIDAGTMVGSVIPVDEVARRVVRAVDRGDFYVLTHPEQREILRRRARRQDQMFEPDRW
jgi:NAD(P)-dependent dehydrogenase (short-subunit alcohol dehydrogenase family)